MKNQTPFLRSKVILVLFFALLIYFFSNDFGLIDIEKAAIVTGIAVDRENDDFNVCMQVAVPKASVTTSENEETVLSAKGKTVGEAIGKIGSDSGWFPKLSFCNIILFGEGVYNEDIISAVEYFTRSIRVQDSALICATEGKAEDVMKKSTPLDNVSSFALQKVLLKNTGIDGAIMKTDIKDFLKNFYSKSKSAYLPLVYCTKTDGSNSNSSDTSQSGQEDKSQEKYVFNANKTLLIKNNENVGVLDGDETLSAIMLKENIADSSLPSVKVKISETDEHFLFRVTKSKITKKITVSGETVTLKVNQKFYVKTTDQTVKFVASDYSPTYKAFDLAKKELNKTLTDNTVKYLKKLKDLRCDVVGIENGIYRFHYKDYDKLKNVFWSNLVLDVKTEIISEY